MDSFISASRTNPECKPLASHSSHLTFDTPPCCSLVCKCCQKVGGLECEGKRGATPSSTWPLGLLPRWPPTESHCVSHSQQTQTRVLGALHFLLEQFVQVVTFDQLGDRKDIGFVELPRTRKGRSLGWLPTENKQWRSFLKRVCYVCALGWEDAASVQELQKPDQLAKGEAAFED